MQPLRPHPLFVRMEAVCCACRREAFIALSPILGQCPLSEPFEHLQGNYIACRDWVL